MTKPAAVGAYIGGKGFGCKLVIVARADIPTEFGVFLGISLQSCRLRASFHRGISIVITDGNQIARSWTNRVDGDSPVFESGALGDAA